MKIAIIGGSGKMGRWFARFLLKEGKDVIVIGRNYERLLETRQQLGVEVSTDISAARNADVVMLSVPIISFEQVVKQLASYTHAGQIIIDITSVKVLPVDVMHRHIKAGLVQGTHPVFGPGAGSIAHQNFVLTPTTEEEISLAVKIKKYLEERDASVTIMTPAEHDEMMAVVLGLSHFIALVSADTLASFGRLKETGVIGGSTYKLLLTLVGSVISEDPELYASLQMSLPGMTAIEQSFQNSARIWAELVENKDTGAFISRMASLRKKLEKDNPAITKAYENMYRIVETL